MKDETDLTIRRSLTFNTTNDGAAMRAVPCRPDQQFKTETIMPGAPSRDASRAYGVRWTVG
jgi:hypothetical protein